MIANNKVSRLCNANERGGRTLAGTSSGVGSDGKGRRSCIGAVQLQSGRLIAVPEAGVGGTGAYRRRREPTRPRYVTPYLYRVPLMSKVAKHKVARLGHDMTEANVFILVQLILSRYYYELKLIFACICIIP